MRPVTLHDVRDGRVVVVDDNLPSVQLVQALLTRAGLDSVPALTAGQDLLDRWDDLAPDLVLLDLHMPGLDGYEMLTELRHRASAADLPVLVLTADTTRDAAHRALELGASDFLTKPLDATELVLRVRNLLQARRSHVGLERRHRWLEASARLARELLTGSCADPLHEVCQLARDAAGADFARIAAAPGSEVADIIVGDVSADVAETLVRALATGGLPAAAAALFADLDATVGRADAGAVGSAALVPLVSGERLLGTLLLCRRPGRVPFTQTDLDLACGFASQAAVAVEFAQARADQERMLVLSDRHRIARDLHDQVIQRLFATGLRLQQLAARLEPGPVAERLDEQVGDLDDTITEIRSTIFGLRQVNPAPERLPARMRRLTTELTEVLGFAPDLTIDAPLDLVPDEIADDVVAAAREAVTNVARHAHASRVQISVTLTGTDVILEVLDDGIGIGTAERRSGLTNLCERACRHGGSCAIGPAEGGGTHIAWTAPLAPDPQSPTRVMATGR